MASLNRHGLMSRKKPTQKQRAQMTREEKIVARHKPACGTFPGMGRARTFKDRKHHANKNACRGKVRRDD
jgi:hypothetical protein